MPGPISHIFSTLDPQAFSQAASDVAKQFRLVLTEGNPTANVAIAAILTVGAIAGMAIHANKST